MELSFLKQTKLKIYSIILKEISSVFTKKTTEFTFTK